MPTRTRYREWTRPLGSDPARIVDSVGVPLDEIDADLQTIDGRLTTAEGDIAAIKTTPNRAIGAFAAAANGVVTPPGTDYSAIPERFDSSGWYDPATGRYSPKVAGYYQLQASTYVLTSVSTSLQLTIMKNNNEFVRYQYAFPSSGYPAATLPVVVQANGTTDYFWVRMRFSIASAGSLEQVSFSGFLIGRS